MFFVMQMVDNICICCLHRRGSSAISARAWWADDGEVVSFVVFVPSALQKLLS